MKFRLPFEFSKEGLTVKYRGTEKLFRWPFCGKSVEHLPDSAKPFKKITGFDYPDILSQWVSFKYPNDHVVVLLNVNVEVKSVQFWARIPQTDIQYFLRDIVVLRCKDQTELERLIGNMEQDFAEAYGFCAGQLITYNREEL